MVQDFSINEARERLEELAERTESERFRILKDGKPIAAIVYIEDLEYLEHLDRIEDEVDRYEIERAKREHGDEPTIPWEDVKKELGIEL
jgi:hypothetical protein